MTSNKNGFTLIELMVVVGMIAILMSAFGLSVSSARERARVQKATADVKVVSQAILAYENYEQGDDNFELPTLNDQDADAGSLGFLIGEGGSAESGGKIPVLLMASLTGGQKLRDPWGTPYKIKIQEKTVTPRFKTATGSMQTGYYLPNFYRLTEDER